MVSMLIVCGKQQEAEGIRTQIREFAGLFSEEKWEYHLCQNTEQLKEYLEKIPEINLACMDLDVKDGIHYARQIRKENRQAFLILIANPEMSPMSYMRPDIMAESLLLRPLKKEVMSEVIREAVSEFSKRFLKTDKEESFVVQGREGRWVLEYDRILYFESRDKRVFVNTADREIAFYDTLDHLQEELPEQFLRCHRSFIVNRKRIQQIQLAKNRIILQGEYEIPVSRTCRKAVKEIGYGSDL